MKSTFALWITGLPASGKSSITAALVEGLRKRGIDPVVLESDIFRTFFTPHPTYLEEDRVRFYQGMVEIATKFVERGLPVVIDATGNRRAYREPARERIPKFAEVFVDCPLEICMRRDPKGIYQKALAGSAGNVPGLQAEYEPPLAPDLRIRSDHEDPEEGARKIIDFLVGNGWIPYRRLQRV